MVAPLPFSWSFHRRQRGCMCVCMCRYGRPKHKQSCSGRYEHQTVAGRSKQYRMCSTEYTLCNMLSKPRAFPIIVRSNPSDVGIKMSLDCSDVNTTMGLSDGETGSRGGERNAGPP